MDSLLVYESDSDSSGDPPQPSPSEIGATVLQALEPGRDSTVESKSFRRNSSLSRVAAPASPTILPPPPDDLLPPGSEKWNERLHGGRTRSFPHVEGNYALHVYIPVTLPSNVRNEVGPLIDRALRAYPGLQLSVEGLEELSAGDCGGTDRCSGRLKLGREYHISLSRTVPIRFQQIESITSMLRHKFSSQNRYLADFDSWETFTNDEKTRTFLSLEITQAGHSEIQKQVALVDEVFMLHKLPTFYMNPRPHISLAWALGEVSSSVQMVANKLNKMNESVKSGGVRKGIVCSSEVTKVVCKIGQRVYTIWASAP